MLRCCLNSSYAEVLFKSGYAEVFMLSQVRDVTQVSEKCSALPVLGYCEMVFISNIVKLPGQESLRWILR